MADNTFNRDIEFRKSNFHKLSSFCEICENKSVVNKTSCTIYSSSKWQTTVPFKYDITSMSCSPSLGAQHLLSQVVDEILQYLFMSSYRVHAPTSAWRKSHLRKWLEITLLAEWILVCCLLVTLAPWLDWFCHQSSPNLVTLLVWVCAVALTPWPMCWNVTLMEERLPTYQVCMYCSVYCSFLCM